MPDHDAFDDRRNALEEAFFRAQDQKVLARLKAEAEKQELKAALRTASGIQDEAVLDRLAELKVSPKTIAAFSLVPLIEVAWSDGKLEPGERNAIEKAAVAAGVMPGSPGHALLESWLAKAPPLELLPAWESYTKSLCSTLEPTAREKLKHEIVGRARKVAEAAGGLLGLMAKISPAEQKLLDRLAKAF